MGEFTDKPIKITLFGAGGRMGTEVALVLNDDPDFEIVGLVERPEHPAVGTDLFGVRIDDGPFGPQLEESVFCEFAGRSAAVKYAGLAAELGRPILIGATGFSEDEAEYLKALGEKIPIMVAPNLSRGIDLFFRIVEDSAEIAQGCFEAEVIEAHHKWKLDAPSGTAKRILELLQKGGYGEVPVHSLRLSDIPGRHTLIFAGEGETLEITHQAASRRAFARGAPAALKFLAGAGVGYYTFRDAIGD